MQLGSGMAVAMVQARATALIGPLAWKPPDAAGAALKRQKDKRKKERKKRKSK